MAWSRVVHLPSADSTNTHLMRALTTDPDAWPHLSVLVTDSQTAGRGRAGRSWHSRPGASLTASVVLLPDDDAPPTTWIPLLVGLAVRRALAPWVPTALKWPNDVLLDLPHAVGGAGGDSPSAPHSADGRFGAPTCNSGAPSRDSVAPSRNSGAPSRDSVAPSRNSGAPSRELGGWGWGPKLGGILCEMHPSGAVVAGVGINCMETTEELPVPWAASIASATGSSPPPREVLDALGASLPRVLADWADHPARVREEYEGASVVVGSEVAVGEVQGRAVGIAEDGALLVEAAGGVVAVTVGDVDRARQ